MDKIVINGQHKLAGETFASGSKNSALPIIFSTLLTEGTHRLTNIPHLADVTSAMQLLESLGCKCKFEKNELIIVVGKMEKPFAHYDQVRKMRASILVLGPMLARMKQAQVSLPGGCAIGTRPIDLHLAGFESMGADIKVSEGYVHGSTKQLKGASIFFESPSVGATENLMMAATLADGITTIENAAKEPEIVDLARYLTKMGAKIKGAGTSVIKIEGVTSLKAAEHEVISDRIEAGTLLVAGGITGGEVTITRCEPLHLEALINKMRECGFRIDVEKNSLTIWPTSSYRGVDITTGPHPSFPTDLQAQYMALMAESEGISVISETVFENRFMHVQELMRMNADITPKTRVAVVRGKKGCLTGAPVMATDLRASACLVLAGLAAKGDTTVNRIYHLDRGYEHLERKLSALGARIQRTS
jgi:UDP-N-acetylglucosamine 1-carboxyvinyltransferase